jgi:hypothetical protein
MTEDKNKVFAPEFIENLICVTSVIQCRLLFLKILLLQGLEFWKILTTKEELTNKFIDLPLKSIIAFLEIPLLQGFVLDFLITKEA